MVKLRRVFDPILTLESKKDLDDLKSFLGDKLFDSYMKIRGKISDPNFKDFSKLKKMDKKDIKDFVDFFQSKSDKKKQDKAVGAKKLYEDSDWVVYRITTHEAAVQYGKGTKWCITGAEVYDDDGSGFFDKYIKENDLDGGYYFYLNKKDPSKKYCVLQTKDKKIDSIWDAKDNKLFGRSLASLLLEEGILFPDIKEVNFQPLSKQDLLIQAIRNSNFDQVKSLVESGANVNVKDALGFIPLKESISKLKRGNDSKKIVEYLLNNGADPNMMDTDLDTSLFFETYIPYSPEIAEWLLKHGADVNHKNNINRTPLLNNVFYCPDTSLIDILIKAGADVNIEDDYGFTPLITAVENGQLSMVKLLLDNGAKKTYKNKEGVDASFFVDNIQNKEKRDRIKNILS